MRPTLLSESRSITKIAKSTTEEWEIASLALAHAMESGINVCPNASIGCIQSCVGSSNVGLASIWPAIMAGRVRKTRMLFEHRKEFIDTLVREIEHAALHAERNGRRLAVRLNTFSDIRFETSAFGSIPQRFDGKNGPLVVHYDYSKIYNRHGKLPPNYHICWSWTERKKDQEACVRLLSQGENVAIPFATEGPGFTGPRAMRQDLPTWFDLKPWGIDRQVRVIDGDVTDLRFTDPIAEPGEWGNVVGLRLKSANNAAHQSGIDSGFATITEAPEPETSWTR